MMKQVTPSHTFSSRRLKTLGLLGGIAASLIPSLLPAQVKPTTITLREDTPGQTYTATNITGSGQGLPSGTNFNLYYGKQSGTKAGINRVVNQFTIGNQTYIPTPYSGNRPFQKVIVNQVNRRVPGAEQNTNKQTSFSEGRLDGSRIYLYPEHSDNMADIINSFIANRGTDNLFANSDGATVNTVERVDLILNQNGVTDADIRKSGFLILERGGNDNFHAAAITGLNPDGTVASLGPLISISTTQWGSSGVNVTTFVLQKDRIATDWHPTQLLDSQPIAGTFITLENLKMTVGQRVYGAAIFPGDVNESMDLIGLTNVPGNTGAGSNGAGGLDFMAGGGYFLGLVNVSGTIFNDADGALVNGTGTNASGQLYVSIVKDGSIVATTPVNPDGTYLFKNVAEGAYDVVMHTSQSGSAAPSLPSGGWLRTGEGAGWVEKDGVQGTVPDALADGITRIQVGPTGTPDITNVNFGIQRPPVAQPQEYALTRQPVSGDELVLNGTGTGVPGNDASPGPLRGEDPEDLPATGSLENRKVAITKLPANGEMYYNNQLITLEDGDFIIENYDPSQLKIVLTGSGYSSVTFDYAFVDRAGVQSPPAPYTILFPSGSLPVTLARFYADAEQGAAVLKWETTLEINTDRFEVEHSLNGLQWTLAGIVEARKNSEKPSSYTFTHNASAPGINYYRLKMVDADQTFTYSKAERVVIEGSRTSWIYPNPVTHGSISLGGFSFPVEKVQIYTISGIEVSAGPLRRNEISVSGLAAGTYILKATGANGVSVHKTFLIK